MHRRVERRVVGKNNSQHVGAAPQRHVRMSPREKAKVRLSGMIRDADTALALPARRSTSIIYYSERKPKPPASAPPGSAARQSTAVPLLDLRRMSQTVGSSRSLFQQQQSGGGNGTGAEDARVEEQTPTLTSARILSLLKDEKRSCVTARRVPDKHRHLPAPWLRGGNATWDVPASERFQTSRQWDLHRDKATRPSPHWADPRHLARVERRKVCDARIAAYAKGAHERTVRSSEARIQAKVLQQQKYNSILVGHFREPLRAKREIPPPGQPVPRNPIVW